MLGRHAQFVMIEGFINQALFVIDFDPIIFIPKLCFGGHKKGLVYETLNHDNFSMKVGIFVTRHA
jgi:hypothetical protein